MGEKTKIEWTNRVRLDGSVVEGKTFNPWMGCVEVSPACVNCYAKRDAERRGMAKWGTAAAGGTRVVTSPGNWRKPLDWADKAHAMGVRPLVFVASWADVFEEWDGLITNHTGSVMVFDPNWAELRPMPAHEYRDGEGIRQLPEAHERKVRAATLDDLRNQLFRLMARTSHGLDWLVLTKRADVMYREWPKCAATYYAELSRLPGHKAIKDYWRDHGIMPNVWAGATVENQEWADRRLPYLRNVPAARIFVSAEPLVGPLDLSRHLPRNRTTPRAMDGGFSLDWVITGGESGPSARPAHDGWYKSLRDQCTASGTSFFFKQHGEWIASDQWSGDHDNVAVANVYPDGRNHTDGDVSDGKVGLPTLNYRVGKHTAGRGLDGEEWSQIPDSIL